MPYVMVPVPEEHEQAFTQELVQLSLRESLNAWDRSVLGPFLGGLGNSDRSLVSTLALASVEGRRLTRSQVAGAIGVEIDVLSSMVDDLNARSKELSQPFLVLVAPGESPDDGEIGEVLLITKVAAQIALERFGEPGR